MHAALKILVLPASLEADAPDSRLASAVTRELIALDADVTRISLADFPLPLFDGAIDDNAAARTSGNLGRMFAVHHGVFIATSEICAAPPPMLLNALAWIAGRGELTPAFQRVFAIGSAADEPQGGQNALTVLRHVLTLGCGAQVLPRQIPVSLAKHAFDDGDRLREIHDSERAKAVARQLVDVSQRMR